MIYDEMEDRPDPADERAEAWEFWHERANKFELENSLLRAALREIRMLSGHNNLTQVIVDKAITDRNLDIGLTALSSQTHSSERE